MIVGNVRFNLCRSNADSWNWKYSAVPYIVLEGKKRDFTLQGAKEVDEYLKEFEKVAMESK